MKIELNRIIKRTSEQRPYHIEYNVDNIKETFPTWRDAVSWLNPASGMSLKEVYRDTNGLCLLECLAEYIIIKSSNPNSNEDINYISKLFYSYQEHKEMKCRVEGEKRMMREEISNLGEFFSLEKNSPRTTVYVGDKRYQIYFTYPEFMNENVRVINCTCPAGKQDTTCRHIYAYQNNNFDDVPIGTLKEFSGIIVEKT